MEIKEVFLVINVIFCQIDRNEKIFWCELYLPSWFQASFNPQDNTQLCVVGNGIFKNFRYSEGNLKAFNFQKMEPQNFLCHAWVSEERVVVGTDTGKLLLFENGEIKNEFNIGASLQDK